MFQRVLVALDGSHECERVIPWLRRVCNGARTTIHLAAVTPPGRGARAGARVLAYAHQQEEQAQAEALAHLRGTAARLREDGYDVVLHTRTGGDAATALLAVAHDARVELIALATRGIGGARALWTRSVAADLIQRSPVPVLVARRAGQRAA
jgi:nucleotide-binding universal stress UspA family protein